MSAALRGSARGAGPASQQEGARIPIRKDGEKKGGEQEEEEEAVMKVEMEHKRKGERCEDSCGRQN